MIKKIERANSGLSLIEVMIVMTVLSVFSIFMVNLLMTSQNAVLIQNTSVPVRAEAKQTMEAMMRELRAADPSADGGIAIANSQITFSIPNEVSNTGVSSWTKIQFSYDQAQRQVTRTEDDTDTTILGRNVESLVFTQADNVITATVGTSVTTSGGAVIQATLTSQAKVRN